MRRVILSVSFADTFRATLTSGLLVLGALVILQTQLINSASAEVTFLNKWGGYRSDDGEFIGAHDIALSGTGQVYVTDRNNDRIQRFDADGNCQRQWGMPDLMRSVLDRPLISTPRDFHEKGVWKIRWPRSSAKNGPLSTSLN